MIRLFEKDATEYTGNGICVLRPSVCTVSEAAGGSYELYMEHPMDKQGRYRLLTEDRQIMAPVPQTHIPEINMPGTTVYRTTAAAELYSKLPVYKRRNKEESDKIIDLSQHQANNSWSGSKGYNEGSYVVYLSTHTIYRARKFNKGVTPGTDSSIWQYICKTLNPGQTTPGEYIPGTVAETLPTNTVVYKLADYDSTYIQVRTLVGGVGYVKRELVQDEETPHAGEVFPEQNFNEQVFRIYNIESEDDTHTYKVYARHISYDFRGNCLYDCQMTKADPMTAIATLEGALMIPDNRIIATDIASGEVTADWSFKNPINAILDPDTGLASILGARVIRNNRNIFLLSEQGKMVNPVTISYGVNMKGVSWSRNAENVYTRIIPRCSDGNSGYLYIDSVFVDSPHINDYPYTRILPLDCPFSVGEEYELPTGEKATRTEESCRAEMLEEAQKKFSQEKIDTVDITLRVDFVLMGDTEEYKQYRGLQFINTYDIVTVNTGISDIQEDAIVWEYEYDSILKRFNSITLRTIKSYKQRIAGYQVQNQSITYSKLSPELANRIRTGDDSGSTSSGSGGYDPQGGVVEFTTPNTATEDGIVTKGQGNSNKVWATDENGNPAWRNSGYTLPAASDSALGGVMTGFTAYDKNYPVALDQDNRAYVYVPWEAGSYTLPLADNGVRGGIQIGFTAYGKNYPVALDGEKAYVYVPWSADGGNAATVGGHTVGTDVPAGAVFTDHYAWSDITSKPATATRWPTWDEVTGKPGSFYTLPLAGNGTRGGVQVGYTQSGKNYPVQLSGEKMYVNVPWTDHYAWSDITDKPATATRWPAWSEVTGKPNRAGSDSDGGPSQTVKGAYTASGGQQNPNYFGLNKVGFLMMNTTVNGNSNYKDWIIMDCYSGNDVGGGVAFGVNRQVLGAYIMRSAAARTSWTESAELIGTHNYTTYTVKKDGTGATGTWGISITGNAATVNNHSVNTDVPANALFTDHQYSAGTGLSLTNGTFAVRLAYTTSGKNYKVQADGSGNLYVNVPWENSTNFSSNHQDSWSFTDKQPLSSYVTFDQSNPSGGPDGSWYNGFVSSHSNYLASYLINKHRSADWYVGYEEFNRSTGTATAPTWQKLIHSGNYTNYTVTKTGGGASGTWGISISGNAATATDADKLDGYHIADIPLLARTAWGGAVTSARSSVHHLVFFNQSIASVWVAGTNEIYVVARESGAWVQYSSSNGQVTVSSWNVIFKRIDGSSSNRISVYTANGSNASISILSM